MRLSISFTDTSLSVARVTEHRWYWPTISYTVALYAGLEWVRDDTNNYPSERVIETLEAARYTARDIARR